MSLEAFKARVLPTKNKLFRFAFKMLGSEEEAKDIVQEVMIKVWNKRDEMHTYHNMEAWCMRITRNLSLDRLKSKDYRTIGLAEGFDIKEKAITPEKLAELKDTMASINMFIASLPEKQKLIIQLRDIEGFSYKEIADILNLNINQVKVNLFRARKSIKENLLNINAYGL